MKNPFLDNFRPYIPTTAKLRELSAFPLLIGTLLGIVFGASSLYLVLKTGLTVSASIPVAVIAITLFRLLSTLKVVPPIVRYVLVFVGLLIAGATYYGLGQLGVWWGWNVLAGLLVAVFFTYAIMNADDATILEANVMQTAGSAGESIAFGLGVTMPAILILGFDLDIWRVTLVAVLGGVLGILMMIPLRRALIRDQHGFLKYPEGTACAQVLIAGASKESRDASHDGDTATGSDSALQGGKIITIGFLIGFVYKSVMDVFSSWNPEPTKELPEGFLKGGSVALENNPALLGVGYIIGPYISAIMFGGGVLSYLVLIPMIKFFGDGMTEILPPATSKLISDMAPDEVRGAYILYIGAGAVAMGGMISLARSLPTIWSGLKSGLGDLFGNSHVEGESTERIDQDLSMKWVVIGVIGLIAAIMLFPQLGLSVFKAPVVSFLGALLIIILGFLFVTVSSRLTGEVGSSSNPISGMTVATLLITCLVFLLLGWTAPNPYFITALSIGGIVCIAASNGGTTSQDLKTGFLVGNTPRNQQIAIIFGALASALVLGPILLVLNNNSTVYAPPTTFSKAKDADDKEVMLPMAERPLYSGEVKPPIAGEFRVFENKVVAGTKKPEVKDLPTGTYLVDSTGKAALKIEQNFPKGAKAPAGAELGPEEKLSGVQALSDGASYRGWHKTDSEGGILPGKYLVDANGEVKYLVDPGVNGHLKQRPDLSDVVKYNAPKATLMSYIIKGILSQNLPWGLVILGAMIAIILELVGIPSLAFAVGIYLPIATSAPIFVGGVVRKLVDIYLKHKLASQNLTEEQIVAETDKSNGVLMASGYIAGAAIAGILIALFAVVPWLKNLQDTSKSWAGESNPFFAGDHSAALGMVPFIILSIVLYFVGREWLLTGKKAE